LIRIRILRIADVDGVLLEGVDLAIAERVLHVAVNQAVAAAQHGPRIPEHVPGNTGAWRDVVVIAAHRGTIAVDSRVGEGTTITVKIPS